ncbi:MAG: heavy-metal-associated domain-containing protein [Pseudonocardia sp.]|jgi:copper chaperone|nr:heavy-metal-associated domain-containing protein [Pseudonocardia sp.]
MFCETVVVAGMNCQHCVGSIMREISGLPDVRSVEVSLSSGLVTIVSDTPVEPAELQAAVELAGYQLLVPAFA